MTTTTMRDHTVLPPEEIETVNQLLAMLRAEPSGQARLVGPDDSHWDLPPEVYQVLKDVLTAMAQGLAITVIPQHTMLTTQEAADLLGVSRPTLVKLLDDDRMPYERRGRHRRLRLVDVLDYQRAARADRGRRLDALVTAAEEHDLYEATSTPRTTR